MIEVNGISKKFGSQWALKETSWQVGDQGALGLLGPNGAGKSTTMKILTGLLRSQGGEVVVDGLKMGEAPLEIKKKIGFLPEYPPLYHDLKVHDYFYFVCGLKGIPSPHRGLQIERVLERLKLEERAFTPIGQLSKGYAQRVGIGQSLLGNPSILIFDEPSSGLDPQQRVSLRKIILDLKKDHVVILSSHMLSEVEETCDEVVILHKGEVRLQGSLKSFADKGQKLEPIFLEVTG